MAASTYKCPSCGGYLAFDPESQKWKCPFCDSIFDEQAVMEKEDAPQQQPAAEGQQVMYRCQNCGSEIMTDETTVATQCYYCHSPVVLEGKLSSEMRPDAVLPFGVDREKAVETFMSWVKTKRFVPKAFFREAQIESMTGVYYPHFVTSCEVDGTLEGEARNIHTRSTPQHIVTTTDHYHVRRSATIRFQSILRPALTKTNRKLSDAIHPYPLEKEKPFSDAYLSGFVAERRDIEAARLRPEIEQEVSGYVQPLLDDTVHYDSKTLHASATVKNVHSRYVLLPTWVLTYPNKQNREDPYYYAMNGCTGEICGKLPIDRKKLYLTALGVGAAVFAAACILSYFVF